MIDFVSLIEVDNDAPYSSWVTVEVTDEKELIIKHEYTNFENHALDHQHQAVVDSENTAIVIDYLQLELSDLTEYLHEEFYHPMSQNEYDDAEALFADLLDLILDCGAKYKLK